MQDAMTIPEVREMFKGNPLGYPIYLTMPPGRSQIDLLFKHSKAVGKFRDIMKEVYAATGELAEDLDGVDFSSFCLGVLVGNGVPFEDANILGPFLRYNLEDFARDPDINPKVAKS